MGGFKLGNRRWYPWLFLVLCIGLFAAAYEFGGKDLKLQWAISALGAAGGLTTFLYTQHLQETRLFTELFQGFNARYNAVNQRLNEIRETSIKGIGDDDRQILMDYFNLCAEEYLYYNAGYIDEAVWRSWARGMKFYAEAPAIGNIWKEELAGESYYGFSLQELEEV
jgi:hypothetical protein